MSSSSNINSRKLRQRNLSASGYRPVDDDDEAGTRNADTKQHGSAVAKRPETLPSLYIIFTIVLAFFIFYVVQLMEARLPPALTKSDALLPQHQHKFIAENAMEFLKGLTDLGPRVAGSYENDVLAVEYLDRKLNAIAREHNASGVHQVEIERQVASGAYQLTFLDGMTMQYNDVHNVIVRVAAAKPTNVSLMFNCHFDSVPDSPGASDDGAACAVMAELFRTVLRSRTPLNYNLIFLFNGAEENIMQASHGFVTQHRWARELKGFINLEACGAGGRELLFQSGPNNPHLLDVYSKVVPYPYASTLAQEIFQSGILPADTDFRIFRDFGELSGVDFAWSSNGYVYHTQYDRLDQIPWGSLQRTGDNMLSLVRGINEQGIYSDRTEGKDSKHQELVFFDLLGAIVVRWQMNVSLLINLVVALCSVLAIYKNVRQCRGTFGSFSQSDYFTEVCRAMGTQLLAWCSALVASLLIAGLLILCNRTMSWYARPVWIYFLYALPTLTVMMAVIHVRSQRAMGNLKRKYRSKEVNAWLVFQIHFDAAQILWTFLMLVTVAIGLKSGFIAILWVFFATINNLLHHLFTNKSRDWRWLVTHIILIGIPFLQSYYLALGAIEMFLPIMGRAGSAFNSEIIIAFLMSAIFAILFSFVSQLIIVAERPAILLRLTSSCTLLAIAVILLTDLGFPYSSSPNKIAPQRFIISNVDKKIFDFSGNLVTHKNGYWFIDMDVNSPYSLQHAVPEIKNARRVDSCDDEIYCGVPYILPVLNFLWETHWLDSAPFPVPLETRIVLNEKRMMSPTVVRLDFSIDGPDHQNLMFAPTSDGITLKGWSIDEAEPLASSKKFKNRNMYFVYYSYGQVPRTWNFWLDFNVAAGFDVKRDPVVDLSLNGHFIHGKWKQTKQLKEFVDRFPSWTTTSSWTSTIRSYVF